MKRIMWSGTVRALPLAGQIKAASIAGCETLSITPFNYAMWLASGLSTRDMLVMAADEGVKINQLDPITRWHANWMPRNLEPAVCPPGLISFDLDDFFRIAEALEVDCISAMVSGDGDGSNLEVICEDFAALCDRAAQYGMRCDLEFVPMWALPDLASAWHVLLTVDRANSGLIFDLWHYLRGRPDPELLASLPGDRISHVQICDGLATPFENNFLLDCLQYRCLPGEGSLAINPVIEQLAAIGALNSVGLEVFSSKFDGMDAQRIGYACKRSLVGLNLA